MFRAFLVKLLRIAVGMAALLHALPASAVSVTTFVSGAGTNVGDCSTPAGACKTFQYAFSQTSAGGEIKALGPADYSSVIINRSITITGVDGAGIVRSGAGDAITITGGASRVLLKNLSLDGLGRATNGINIATASAVEIVNCAVRRFAGQGLVTQHTGGAVELFVSGLRASNNGGAGIRIAPTGTGTVGARLNEARLDNNNDGLYVDGQSTLATVNVTAIDSSASGNTGSGVTATQLGPPPFHTFVLLDGVVANTNDKGLFSEGLAQVRITRSSFAHNTVGVSNSGTIESHGTNAIRGNNADTAGAATTQIGSQ